MAAPEIFIWGLSGCGRPPEAEAVWRHCLQILTAQTITIWKFSAQSTHSFLTSLFHGGWATKRHFEVGLAHKPTPGPPLAYSRLHWV